MVISPQWCGCGDDGDGDGGGGGGSGYHRQMLVRCLHFMNFTRRLTRHRLATLNFRRLGPRSLRSRGPRQRKFKVAKRCQTSPPCAVHCKGAMAARSC
ncbi:hypothetical protein TYRP_001803 [Tyrophagus putrescentiae]|nr:hypothetical protein TYRP_001803 [Tyrophagus putrescentiae]